MGSRKSPSFEELIQETEAIIQAMEEGNLPLEESLAKYEKGIANLCTCGKLLAAAEEKIKVLREKSEGIFTLEEISTEKEE